ncbi:MAG: tetratricopeptide repeat protein [Terriglobia bacterium]
MALLGFDKSKVLQAAEKYVLQGKIEAAINEYHKILKKDPKDLLTLNTIGDLYARGGKKEEALKCFHDLAEKSIEAGFVPRSIAVYKRITKLDPDSIPPWIKLGELYSMQGLLRDARTHYLQAVELHMRRREKERAREVFEKVLLLDMENPKLQFQMAELYAETGKKEEAIATYLAAVERFLDRNEPSEATRALDALQKLDPDNPESKILYGRLFVEQGDYARAVQTLQSIPSPAGHKGALNWLFHAYMKQGDVHRGRDIATQLFDLHEDFAGLAQVCDHLLAGGDVEEAFGIYSKAWNRLAEQQSHTTLIEGLQKILSSQPSHPGALELLWQVHRHAGNRGEAEEIGEVLAHSYVTNGEIERARDLLAELVELAPENQEFAQLLRQVNSRLPEGARFERVAEPTTATPASLDYLEEKAPSVEGSLSPRDQEIVRNCVTESELYITYRQYRQAIEVLEKGLAEVPGNTTLQENLLRICEQAGQYQKAAACAQALTETYVMLGDGDRATQYGELTLTLQHKALQMEAPVTESASAEAAPSAGIERTTPAATQKTVPAEAQVREVDLSMEWAALSGAESAPAPPVADSVAEEIEFYLQAGLASEAAATLDRLREQSPSHPSLTDFEARLGVLRGEAVPAAEPAQEELIGASTSTFGDGGPPTESAPPVFSPELPAELPSAPATTPEPELVLEDMAAPMRSAARPSSFELSLEEAHVADKALPAGKAPGGGRPQDQLANLAGELNDLLGEPAPPAAAGSASGGLLDDVFAEFKEEMEEPSAVGAGDIETHYNMGIAFREMALYDEAIGEFQKAYQFADTAKDTPRVVQCCSLLATCFLEKGLPQLAVRWYQTALNAPALDAESSLALLYEVGSAQEVAGDRAAALKSFMEVYARNIDYRNVSERIRDLQ